MTQLPNVLKHWDEWWLEARCDPPCERVGLLPIKLLINQGKGDMPTPVAASKLKCSGCGKHPRNVTLVCDLNRENGFSKNLGKFPLRYPVLGDG